MKLQAKSSALRSALSTSARACGKGNAMPILGMVHVKSVSGGLELFAIGHESGMSIIARLDAVIAEQGDFCIDPRKLGAFLGTLSSNSDVVLSTEYPILNVSSGRARLSVPVVDGKDAPQRLQFKDNAPSIKLDGPFLQQQLSRTAFCACEAGSGRGALEAVHFRFGPDKLTLEGASESRVSRSTLPSFDSTMTVKDLLVPAGIASEVLNLIDDAGSVELTVDENKACFAFGSVRLYSPIMTGTYPDVDPVISRNKTKNDKGATLLRVDILSALKRIRIVEESLGRIELEIRSGAVYLESKGDKTGSSCDEVDAETIGPLPFRIACKGSYLEQILSAINSEKVTFTARQPNTGMAFTIPEDNSFVHILMPYQDPTKVKSTKADTAKENEAAK